MSDPDQNQTQPVIRVFYDGSCPLCRREIRLYQGLPSKVPIHWCDVSEQTGGNFSLPLGRCELMQRFHIQTPAGQLHSGAAGFVYLWSQLPGWRWLAAFADLPGMLWVMECAYRGFLKVRPFFQRLFKG